MSIAVPAGDGASLRELSVPHVAALVGQELDAGRCPGLILNYLTTFQDLVLDFVSTSPRLFSSLALVVLNFLSRKLTTFRVFPKGNSEVVGASLRKS